MESSNDEKKIDRLQRVRPREYSSKLKARMNEFKKRRDEDCQEKRRKLADENALEAINTGICVQDDSTKRLESTHTRHQPSEKHVEYPLQDDVSLSQDQQHVSDEIESCSDINTTDEVITPNQELCTTVEEIQKEQNTLGSRVDDIENPDLDIENKCQQNNEASGCLVDELLYDLNNKYKWIDDDIETEEIDVEFESELHDYEFVEENSPIQPGHHLTLQTSALLIWMFSVTHSLTSVQLSDLLVLLNMLLLYENPALKSLYRFKKIFSEMKSQHRKHWFCSFCYTPASESDTMCNNKTCDKSFTVKNSKSFFLDVDIKVQLANLYKRKEFQQNLESRFKRQKKKEANIEDVYDSNIYKKLCENGEPLLDKNNITFTFNTDGIPIFKSSNMSAWPIFLMINELPFKMRKLRDNMILCGLWYGRGKPEMNVFLKPLQSAMQDLQTGIEIELNQGEKISVKGFLFACCCDIPARNQTLNMNQHNGQSCCPKCLQTGENCRTESGGNVRVFPFNKSDPIGPVRTTETVLKDAEKAMNGSPVNGIKGPSSLMFFPRFDFVNGISIDYMHGICLGVVRLLLKLWFNVSNRTEEYSLYSVTDIVDSRLEAIRPPHYITRQPRSISQNLKFWKASELRSWFFYYSIPCLYDLMQPKYLYHFCALVQGIFLLCQASISPSDIEKSFLLLQYFNYMVPALYGDRYMTINVHSLLHLPQTVENIGPLWCISCFPFESANGEILKMFHGNQYIDLQIINAVHVFQLLPNLVDSIIPTPVLNDFVQRLRKTKHSVLERFSLLGKSSAKKLHHRQLIAVIAYFNAPVRNMDFFGRASIRDTIYHSKDYQRVTNRNSYTVKYFDAHSCVQFGFILWFANVTDDEAAPKIVCIQKMKNCDINLFDNMNYHSNTETDNQSTADNHIKNNFMNISLPHVHFCNLTDDVEVVHLKNVIGLCTCVETENSIAICEEPNPFETNL